MTRTLVLALVIAVAAPAAADKDRVSGFMTTATGELTGRVTDEDGKPLARAKVFVSTATGELNTTTDVDGRYKIMLREPGSKLVYVRGVARIGGQATVAGGEVDGEEVVEIRELLPPAVMPKPLTSASLIPAYSETAKDRDAWTKAWLMLDVSETGAVTRLKLIRAPGFDLDAIAVRDAFKLRFEPARDRVGHPIRALMLWSYEWPSAGWLRKNALPATRMAALADKVPCRGTGPSTSGYYRDCTPSDIAKSHLLPWLDPPKR